MDFINFHFVLSISLYFPNSQPCSPHCHLNFPHSHLYFYHSYPDSPPIPIIFTLISGLISRIPAPILRIPIIPTLIPSILIIPLILFPDSPFQLLQTADFSNVLVKTVLLDSSWGKKRIFEKIMFGFEKGYVFSISTGARGML